jgi:hypothetical protein
LRAWFELSSDELAGNLPGCPLGSSTQCDETQSHFSSNNGNFCAPDKLISVTALRNLPL